MPETYTEEELAKAWAELDTVQVDYNRKWLARICVQARKNRLWEAHGNVEMVTSVFMEVIDEKVQE